LKLIALNPEAQEAKEWVSLKIQEAVDEAKETKKQRQIEEQLAIEKATSTKENIVRRAVAPLPEISVADPSTSETSEVTSAKSPCPELQQFDLTCDDLEPREFASSATTTNSIVTPFCCAKKQCIFYEEDVDLIVDDGAPLKRKCNVCKGDCHAGCGEVTSCFIVCLLCKTKRLSAVSAV
jgi:hypothetical protein